ncbi:MAG TPA: JAB domain-containing protein [Allosphingosinicella sp.]|nr:JAB domain-containing protein [Allosphingosinicella sp.]
MVIVTARDAAALLAPLFADVPGERLAVLHLDRARRPVAVDAYEAAEAEILLPMRAIFAVALGHDAAGMVIAHNHPSGDPRPSRADREATRRIAETAASLGVILHDHLIFAGTGWQSLRESGML